jgi:hypothetical protein
VGGAGVFCPWRVTVRCGRAVRKILSLPPPEGSLPEPKSHRTASRRACGRACNAFCPLRRHRSVAFSCKRDTTLPAPERFLAGTKIRTAPPTPAGQWAALATPLPPGGVTVPLRFRLYEKSTIPARGSGSLQEQNPTAPPTPAGLWAGPCNLLPCGVTAPLRFRAVREEYYPCPAPGAVPCQEPKSAPRRCTPGRCAAKPESAPLHVGVVRRRADKEDFCWEQKRFEPPEFGALRFGGRVRREAGRFLAGTGFALSDVGRATTSSNVLLKRICRQQRAA